MGLYEQNPLVLVPIVLVIVALYDIAKWVVKRALDRVDATTRS